VPKVNHFLLHHKAISPENLISLPNLELRRLHLDLAYRIVFGIVALKFF